MLTTRLTRIMMPILALISVSAVFMGILNSQRRYGAPAYAPAMFNVTSIAAGLGLWVLGTRGPTGIVIWAAATTAGRRRAGAVAAAQPAVARVPAAAADLGHPRATRRWDGSSA